MTQQSEPSKLLVVPEDWKKAVAVVAHPDDLEYGAASAIARWTAQGKEIVYLLVTRGEAGIDAMAPEKTGRLREQEELKSAAAVGVHQVEFLNYIDGVVEYGLPLRRDLARAFRRHKPDFIIGQNYQITFRGGNFNMADHRAVGLATLDAARDAGNRWIFPELLSEGHEPWNQIKYVAVNGSPNLTHAVDITDSLDKGIASLKEHKVYIENLPFEFNPEEFLTWGAAAVGPRIGVDYAVGFEVFNM